VYCVRTLLLQNLKAHPRQYYLRARINGNLLPKSIPSPNVSYRSTMKLHLSLLSILPTLIAGMPSGPLERSTDIERKSIESRLVKGNTQFCSATTCGVPTNADCLLNLATLEKQPADFQHCTTASFNLFFGAGACQLIFGGHKPNNQTTCISSEHLVELLREVLNTCVNNSDLGVGGCIELEDSGHVCVRTENFGGCR